MSETVAAKKVFTPPYALMLCALAAYFLLPQYGSIVLSVGSAGVLSAYVAGMPESFRSRSGSMTTAYCLVAALWSAAAVVTVLTLTGEMDG